MMLDTWDGQIWYPRFYDIDTILSYDNSGEIKFDVDIEMEQGYWNTSSSRLWTKVRDNFHDELVEVYKQMRGNGVTYEQIMYYMYDEQIAKIPQTYYNMDYDIKYAPYADQYIGKAHGDGYEHMKRWLKRRFIFCDTLFDYTPSYTNDVLTIRANTLDLMSLEIETYTPVYQHVSFYNGNMEKIKIDGKTATTFEGTAQTATDQEVLIYGGSNIKAIRGIQSMNPNSMLIGGATRLTELDISNCPILTIVNSNKANFSPHTYLNKLNISNCPQLGGNLNVSNSPLLQEINARGSAITGLLLPTSLRNLKTLELPNTISSLALYDVSSLETLKFDEGVEMQSIELSNCPGITNTENFDLTKTPTVILDNSYNTDELYMSETTNLTLRNMSNLERVIYTPNSEYSEFDINNVIGGKNYKVTTNGCPKLKTFMTTAPHRDSYNNGEYGDITPNTVFTANTLDLSATQFTDIKLLCTTDVYNLKVPTTMKNFYCDSAMDIDTDVIEDASYEVIHEELIEPYTTNYEGEVSKGTPITDTYVTHDTKWVGRLLIDGTSLKEGSNDWYSNTRSTDYLKTTPGKLCEISHTVSCGLGMIFFDKDKEMIGYQGNNGTSTKYVSAISPNGTAYVVFFSSFATYSGTATIAYYGATTPNIIPSSANGSLIFNMYSNNTTQPTSTSPYMWDLTGLKLEDFYTYGMNNNVKPSEESVKRIANIPFIYGAIPNSTAGNPATFRVDIYQCMFVLRVEPGEVYSFTRINDTDGTAPYYGFGDSYYDSSWNTVYVNPGYTSGTVTVPEGAVYAIFTPKYIMEHNKPYINKKHYIPIGDGSYLHVTPTEDCAYSYTTANFSNSVVLDAVKSIVSTPTGGNSVLVTSPTSITMPQRMPGYSVRLVNADITPDEYPTMLYPKLIDVTLPITGKLDYTKYNGTSLAWAYAYTTGDVSINPLDSRSIGQIEFDYNKLYGTDFVDVVDVWVYKDTDTSKLSTNETITKAYIELTNDNYTTRIDEVLQWYPNCTDLYLFEDGSITTLYAMFDGNNQTYKTQIEKIVFIEGYFNNLTKFNNMFSALNTTNGVDYDLRGLANASKNATSLSGMFQYGKINSINFDGWDGSNIKSISNMFQYTAISIVDLSALDLSNVENMSGTFRYTGYDIQEIKINSDFSKVTNLNDCFHNCYALNQEFDFSKATSLITTGLQNTFYDCQALTTPPILPTNYTGSMANCFQGCTSLTTAPTIPEGVTNMNSTFYGCSALTTASTIPSSVTNMSNTFYGCSALTTASTIPSGVTSMYETFRGCTSLTTAPNIPSSVTSLEKTFYGCSALTTPPTIPSGVTSMYETFNDCTSLTTAPAIPDSVTSMNGTFRNCTSLTTAPTIPESVYAYAEVIYGCKNITSITLPLTNVTTYGGAIRSSGVTDVTWQGLRSNNFDLTLLTPDGATISQADIQELVPEHLADLTELGTTATLTLGETYGAYLTPDEVFSANQKGWTIVGASNDFTIINASDDISGYTTDENVLSCFIELTSDNYKTRVDEVLAYYPNCTDLYFFEDGTVTTLADMFNNSNNNTYKSKIKKIEFMDGYFQNLTSLNYSFYNCTALTDISNIPSSVENMYRAFYYCGSLVNVSDLPDGVTNVDYTFYQCDSLVTAPKLGKSATVLDYTFYGCDKLQSIPEFPPNVTKLTGTFSGCSKLTSVPDIPNSVTDMSNAFYNCSRLVVAPKLPNSVNTLSSTFQGCSSLQTPPSIIPKSVTNASGCFNGCISLVTPPEFEHVDGSDLYAGRMYQNCSKMTTAPKIPNGVDNILGMFVGCSALTIPPTIPDSVTNMQETFSNCTGLTQNPNVPTGVTNLKYAFSNSSITAITIPLTNLTTYDYAISKCPNLTDVTWVGELTSTFNVKNLYYRSAIDNTTPTATDIQELVPEHLGTVTGETLTLGDYISYLTEDEIAQAVAKGWTIQ